MLRKQAKTLSGAQIKAALVYLSTTRHPVRNRAILLLSVRAGLRAKEIAALSWSMVTDAEGRLGKTIRLEDSASKGSSGGVIPLAKELRSALDELLATTGTAHLTGQIIRSERRDRTSAQVIVNMFDGWFRALGFEGCSSHSGRRTFITMNARHIGRFGGSLRDVQSLARHRSLATTQRYIDVDTQAMAKVVDGW